MPGAGPIIERVWEFVRSNPQAVADMLRAAKDRFANAPPAPPGPGAPEQPSDSALAQLDQIEADITAVGRLLGGIEARLSEFSARLDGIDRRIDRSEAELVRATQALTQLGRKLRMWAIALTGGLVLALGLLAYLVSR